MSGLGFGMDDDEPPRQSGPAGRRRSVRRRRRLTGLGILVALVVVLVVIAVVAVRAVSGLLGGGGGGDYTGAGTGTVLAVVHQGDSESAIGATLVRDGVVRSESAFVNAAAANSRAQDIGPGTYRLHRKMKASLAVSLLLTRGSLVDYRVTIPEGFTAESIVSRVAADTPITASSLKAALAHPGALGLPAYATGHVEGFLFPATYDVQPGTTATQLLSTMVARFGQAATSVGLTAGARRIGLTPYQVVTLASIVQREGRLTTDFPKIAEVFTNRLRTGMRLDSDATLYYVLGAGHGPLTATDLMRRTPYNTRLERGLPPTPINSPGAAALTAVLHHPSGPYLYFVTIDKAGHTAFATTLAQFDQLVARSRANGVS
jgi:UPF0755 protein